MDEPVSARNASSSDSVSVCSLISRGRALRDDAAVVDDADAVGDAVGLVHVMGGQEDGDALGFVELFDVSPELVAALRIEAERGLVEEEDLRRVQEAAGDFETPLHAAGELLDLIVAALPEFEELEQFFGAHGGATLRGTW